MSHGYHEFGNELGDELGDGLGVAETDNSTDEGHVTAKISPSVSMSVSSSGKIEDVMIEVDKKPEDSGLTIYNTKKADDIDYIEDPSKVVPVSTYQNIQLMVQKVLENIFFRLLTVLLILLDLILVIIDLSIPKYDRSSNNGLEFVSHAIIAYFVLEVFLRIFYMEKRYFYNWMEVLDGLVVMLSFIVDMIFVVISDNLESTKTSVEDYAKLLMIGRVFRFIRLGRIIYFMVIQRKHVSTASRHVVSQNKRRYQKDGFDLDLCYITERIIAMSFPSKGLMAVYRNPVREVARFFNTKHNGHYRLYNLCSERDYDETLFQNRVERIFIDDHNVPTVKDMVWFCDNAEKFMSEDKQNVMAIHCKGGKGRTGTIICVWLVHCGIFEDAKESLDYFGDRRTDLTVGTKFQGVETPSQVPHPESRFVGYYEKVKKLYYGQLPPKKELKIKSFKIESIAGVGNGDGSDFSIELRVDGLLIFECRVDQKVNCEASHDRDNDTLEITLRNAPTISDDVKVRFVSSCPGKFPKIYDHCAFYFWFHCTFIEKNKLRLVRDEIDNPHKMAARKVFRDTFAVEVQFENADTY